MKITKKWDRQAFIDNDGKKVLTHIRVAQKKYGIDKIPKDFEIHHIDKNKDNNEYHNLIMIHKKDHRRIHLKRSLIIKSVRPKDNLREDEFPDESPPTSLYPPLTF